MSASGEPAVGQGEEEMKDGYGSETKSESLAKIRAERRTIRKRRRFIRRPCQGSQRNDKGKSGDNRMP